MVPIVWRILLNQLGSSVGLIFLAYCFIEWFIGKYQEQAYNIRLLKRIYYGRTADEEVFNLKTKWFSNDEVSSDDDAVQVKGLAKVSMGPSATSDTPKPQASPPRKASVKKGAAKYNS